ncbi:MAG: thiamine biosynthesis protein ApbE [Oceanospirillaceae bacterium]|nr:thiamine biosynthesis protein ApbE [Oceanospirillaceae bacterium]
MKNIFLLIFIFFSHLTNAADIERLSYAEDQQQEKHQVKVSTILMTTDVTFTLMINEVDSTKRKAEEEKAHNAINSAIGEIQRIEALLSEWQPDSEISQINLYAAEKPVIVSRETYRLLHESLNIAKATQGKFDITFKSAGKLWDFRKKVIPSAAELQQAVSAIDYHKVVLNDEDYSVRFTQPGTRIGLGGIAKGYAVDRAVQIIGHYGFREYSVTAGGDLYAAGDIQQKRWRVGIRHPREKDQLIALLPVANAAVATSGDYERYFEKGGKRYHHIIDPATGQPAQDCMSVTILSPRAYLADALATGVFVLGAQQGMALINSLPDTEAMIIDAAGNISVSAGLNDLQAALVSDTN